jgi:L-alanine-DL-glutamate epimerase-like enolase superfamily enzyme
MKITALETVRIAERPNILWVLLHTDQGLTGLGETFFGPAAVEAHLHDWAAPRLIGQDPTRIEALAASLRPYVGSGAPGAEVRGHSAIDIALWDLLGKATGQPLAVLLGGFTRPAIRTYNTCAGPDYIRAATGQQTGNYGAGGDLDDLTAFQTRADDLALSLLDEGITGMKIWPFDAAAEASGGLSIDAAALKAALQPFEKIRAALGDRMAVMVEFHGMWHLPPAQKIARALAPFAPEWMEDPLRDPTPADLRAYAATSPAPVAMSEMTGSLPAFDALLGTDIGVVILDLSWCGGLTTGRKVAALAEAKGRPIAPHDCTGPVVLAASTHLSLAAPNALVQESVRAFHRGWYRDAVTALPPISGGMITVPPGPGLGLDLSPDLDRAFTTSRRRSDAASI